MILIKNAHILTMCGNKFENGCIAFDSKIRRIGEENEFQDADFETVIDAQGGVLTPGLIDAHCHAGMFEDSLGFEGDDGNEDSDPITPHLRALDAINPFDRCFADAVNAGITTVVTGPGSANPIGGTFTALKTHGICVDDMILREPAAMKFALGENPKSVYHGKNQTPVTRMGTAALIRETLFKAREYMEALDEYAAAPDENDKPEFDIKMHALIPVLRGELPVKIHAHRADDICTAIRIGKEFNLDFTIEHCTDAEAVLPILERERVPIMLGPTLTDRSKPELKSMSFGTYKELSDKGLSVAIITDHPEITVENLPLCAAMAVRCGMDKEKALEAMTCTAAKNCRIADRVGELKSGADADIALFTAHPTDFNARCILTVIEGKIVKNEL